MQNSSIIYVVWLYIRTILVYVLAGAVTLLIIGPFLLVVSVCSRSQCLTSDVLQYWLYLGNSMLLRMLCIKVEVEGRERIPHGQVLIVANHASSLDIPLIATLLQGKKHLWFAFERFFNTPVLRIMLHKFGVSVYQDNTFKAGRCCVQGIKEMKQYGVSGVIFPEGGRYMHAEVQPFFTGFAILARKVQVPVIPVLITHAGKVYPPGSFLIYPHTIHISIGPEFVYNEGDTDIHFSNRVREWFLEQQRAR